MATEAWEHAEQFLYEDGAAPLNAEQMQLDYERMKAAVAAAQKELDVVQRERNDIKTQLLGVTRQRTTAEAEGVALRAALEQAQGHSAHYAQETVELQALCGQQERTLKMMKAYLEERDETYHVTMGVRVPVPMYVAITSVLSRPPVAPAPHAQQVVEVLRPLADLAQDHQVRYSAKDREDYWRGRRDEAGWLGDQIRNALAAYDADTLPNAQDTRTGEGTK